MKKLFTYCVLLTLFSCSNEDQNVCVDTNCVDYQSQTEAQMALDLDPDCHNDLDADNDGIACEDLLGNGNSFRDCPNTSNCGCSGINKPECNTSCCAWVVGQGCKCR